MKPQTKRLIIFAFSLLLTAWVVAYTWMLESDAFSRARDFLQQSPYIKERLGSIVQVRLSPLHSSMHIAGLSGRAEFSCIATGSLHRGVIQIKLERNLGSWRVISASLDNNFVPLSPS